MTYVFIDESGDLGKKQGAYFIMVGIITSNPEIVRKIIMERFGSPFRRYPANSRVRIKEIKAHDSDSTIRSYILSELSKTDCDIYAIAVQKDKILSRYEPSSEQNKLYHAICSRLLIKVGRRDDTIYVIMDERHKERQLRKFFSNYIEKNFLKVGQKIRFRQVPSHDDAGLIVVDFVAWAVGRKFNFDDDSYLNLIKNKIRNFDTMDSWALGQQRRKLGNDFKGVIFEESLEDRSILKRLKIIKTNIEKVPDKYNIPWLSQWTKDIVVISESDAGEIAEEIRKSSDRKHSWPNERPLAYFNNKKVHFVVLKDKVIRTDKPPE